MRYNDRVNSFTDLNPVGYLRPPHLLIRAADITDTVASEIRTLSDIYHDGNPRKVIFEDDSGTSNAKYYHECVPFLMPTGAVTVTLGSLAYSAANVATYTVTLEGRLILETGVLAGADASSGAVAGMLFTDYYTHFTGNYDQLETGRAVDIAAGDFLWVVRRGRVFLDADGAVSDLDMLKCAANGEVTPSAAINTAGTIAQYHASIEEHWWGMPTFEGVAQARAAIGGAGLVECDLNLPVRYAR